jgi:hypothetical protein
MQCRPGTKCAVENSEDNDGYKQSKLPALEREESGRHGGLTLNMRILRRRRMMGMRDEEIFFRISTMAFSATEIRKAEIREEEQN